MAIRKWSPWTEHLFGEAKQFHRFSQFRLRGLKKINIEVAKQMLPPRQLDEELCTKCGVCGEECPAQAITFDPYPRFGAACFLCYNCVRLCEENAIKTDLSSVEGMLKERAGKSPERQLSQVFV